ncbi:MAG TPA: MauE/DoxX family redox-associated membrane protein [Candidatus Binataceae bacterium]|nr:MauE/DoxX family redox-associated membrane protein [Candidatus Binataceae bacterium]
MPQIDPVVGWMAAGAAAAIFAASGGLKFYDLETFRGAVLNYRLLPEPLATPFAWTAPVIECAAALGLLLTPIRGSAALALIAMLTVFSGAIAINLARGRTDIDCGCFGPALRQRLSWWLLLRNAALFVLLAIALLPMGPRTMGLLDLATAIMAAATVIVLYTAANYLIANAPGLRALGALNA